MINSETIVLDGIEIFELGADDIDDQHYQFAAIVDNIHCSDKQSFPQLFTRLCEHVAAHFEYENSLMEKHEFPAKAEHSSEHLRVLGELVQLNRQVEKGRPMMAQAYVKERLPEWFSLHLATMDSALVAHLKKSGVVK